MKFAFSLYRYFPYGGLERDFLRIAQECRQRGHSVHVFTMSWEGAKPRDFEVNLLPVNSWSNHGRNRQFSRMLESRLSRETFNVVIGFNKMPGLDVYYAADPCFVARIKKTKPPIYRLTQRYRHFAHYERLVFGPNAEVDLLMISDIERQNFIRHYQTPAERFHLLPPGINPDRKAADNAEEIRSAWRQEFHVGDEDNVVLMVGSDFKRKGLDRATKALASLPESLKSITRLIMIGQDNPAPFKKLARKLGVDSKVQILSGRDDVPRFLLGADVFLHPAYSENTGTVILEAMIAGLPVLITGVCGYAFHVLRAQAGLVLDSPFEQAELTQKLKHMLTASDRKTWSLNGIRYGASEDLYSLPIVAADIIESVAKRKAEKH